MNSSTLPLILDPVALKQLPPHENLLLIAVCQERVFDACHIPGSLLIRPSELMCGIKPATGKLPTANQLSEVFSRVGLREDSHVIVYDDEGGGWAGRLIWTLDVIGHHSYSYLDGGLIAWHQAEYPMEAGLTSGKETAYTASIDRSVIADIEEIIQQIDDPHSIVWDARSAEEYDGSKVTALRNGHIPGAVNFDWLRLMDRDKGMRLRPLDELTAALNELGINAAARIITHCQSHHRSGLSYLVGKALGLNIKAYDGSWSEWGNHPDTPIEQTLE